MTLFISIRILDVIDIILVAFLLYQLYRLIRGTVAINIFGGIALLYMVWLVVQALNMELLSNILGQVLGVGVIALIVVFQQEIRKFLLLIGSRYVNKNLFTLQNLFGRRKEVKRAVNIEAIVQACANMSESKTGALIVIARRSEAEPYAQTGDLIDAATSSRLLQNIFFKNSPLHDGAVIIVDDRIYAARCVLPVSENLNLPPQYGLRHKAAIGLSEVTEALVVLVSEETGKISAARNGKIRYGITPEELNSYLLEQLK